MEQIKELINKNSLYYIISIVIVLVVGIVHIKPQIEGIITVRNEIAQLQAKIDDFKSRIKPESAKAVSSMPVKVPVIVYNSPYPGLDIENASVDLVDQFILMVRDTQNRIVEISFTANPESPSVPAGDLSLNLTLNGSYVSFQNLMQQVYRWKYLAAIKNFAITTTNGSPDNLNIKLTIDLYINKS